MAVTLLCALLVGATGTKPASATTTVAAIAPGGGTNCSVVTGGAGYCWGDNAYGQVGDGTTTPRHQPTLVSGNYTWASLSSEYDQGDSAATTCGVTTGGDAYCWGHNSHGEIGDGTTTERDVPTLVSGSHVWSSISVGAVDVCGITTANLAYCWGANWDGEVGDNTQTQRTSPTAVSGGLTWTSITVGSYDACGVTTTGDGYCWGWNTIGQTGDGTTTQHHVPTAISGAYQWSNISAGKGNGTNCGVTTSGVGYCWGYDGHSEFGDGGTANQTVPTAVSGSHTWISISSGSYSTCGLTTSNDAYCWGVNWNGQIGDNSGTSKTVPTAVYGGLKFSSVIAGANKTASDTNCGLALDGVEYCWGYNSEYQIGNNANADKNVPTEANWLLIATGNTTTSVTILPSFTFSVANQSSPCNGEANFASGAGSSNAIALGNLTTSSNVSGGQLLSVAGNAGGGFAVYVSGAQANQNLQSATHNWTDVSGTYAAPAALASGEQFGYTYKDSTASSAVVNPAAATFIALTNAANNEVMGSSSSESGSGCISFDAQTGTTTPPGTYVATVIYTAVPTY